MSLTNVADIRNIAIMGHTGAGKTTLTERLLFATGTISRMGSIDDGNTVSDFSPEEKKHKHSLNASVVHCRHNGKLINIIDTPGLADFAGHAIKCFPAVDLAMIVVDAVKGVEPMTRRMMAVAAERNMPRLLVVNKIEDPNADLEALVEELQAAFGNVCMPIELPAKGKEAVIDVLADHPTGTPEFSDLQEAHTHIIEQVVESSEDLMAEYLERGTDEGLDKSRLHDALEKALRESHLIPICFCSAKTGAGIADLLHVIIDYCPSPTETNPRPFLKRSGETEEVWHAAPDPALPTVAHVFKVSTDPFIGKLGVFRIHQGTVKTKGELYLNDEKKPLRIGHLFKLNGKDHVEIDSAGPGDIVAVAKIEEMKWNGVLHSETDATLRIKPLPLPKPMFGLAVELKNHADETKFSNAVAKLVAEDPCFTVQRVEATRQTVARGLGELHLRIILERLKESFGIDVNTATPKVAYKETITAPAEGHHRHKKQTGGSGEFGEVYLRVIPLPIDHPEGFEFENATVGGSVPRQFMPAIEKGIRQVLGDGAIAGYPMTGIRVEVYDGKYHAVDSKEVAFSKAGKWAFIDAVKKARPALLEPIVKLEITAPAKYMGDIAGDLATKRGRVQNTDITGSDLCIVYAQAPLSDLQNYSNELKSITAGQGSYTMDYSHDEQTPAHIQAEVAAAYKPHAED